MKVFVCSPYSGDIPNNIAQAKRFALEEIECGNFPYVPHLYLPLILDDLKPSEREAGIKCGIEFLKVCDELHVYMLNGQISSGMRQEIAVAESFKIPIIYFYATPNERTRLVRDV